MNTTQRQQAFRQWHEKLRNDLDDLLKTIEAGRGADAVAKAMEAAFGPRASQAVLAHSAQRRESLRAAGRAAFIVSGTSAIVTPSRAHTYFGGAHP
jgi:hypothetical protein